MASVLQSSSRKTTLREDPSKKISFHEKLAVIKVYNRESVEPVLTIRFLRCPLMGV